ncbi:hypothetical protein PAMP_015617 [Pampus punctatissimus]
MEDRSSTHTFPSHHHHRHRPSFHLTLPGNQSPEVGYPSSQHVLDSLEQYGSRGEESVTSFPTSITSSGERKGSNGGDRGFLNTSGSALDGDVNLGGHFDRESSLGGHFVDSWYGSSKKEDVWDDGESCESTADDFYNKSGCYRNTNDVFYTRDCAKTDTVYIRDANVSHYTKQTSSYNRSDGSVDYCRTDSRVSDSYLGREEDYGSSGSGEDQLQPAEVEQGPWLSYSPLSQTGDGRWRGASDTHALASGCLPQRAPMSINSGTYTQKLDSFSEAFLSQRKRRFPVIPSGNSSGHIWDFGVGKGESSGLIKSRHSCAFDTDSYLPPSSSSSPIYPPSLSSFPSPPTSSHLMSSVLSPPPTPLPPPSHSPSKMDSPSAFGGTTHSGSQGGETLGGLQFFASRLQPLPSVHSSGMIWKFPLLSHCFPQSSDDPSSIEDNIRPSHGSEYANITALHDVLQSPESTLLTSSSHRSSLQPSRALCPSNTPSLHPSFPSQLLDQHNETDEKNNSYMMTQKVKNEPVNLSQSQLQQQSSPTYTGIPFLSILQTRRGHRRGRYTPQPHLNPARKGTGLYSSLSSLHYREEETACEKEEEKCGVLPWVNVGCDYQAELPLCCVKGESSGVWSPEDESPREQLLWKPWDELEDSTNLQDRGGGSNKELALHCLHYCQGNTMATLEMLLFSQPSSTRDYHYSGSDLWTDSEKNLFSGALETYGKDFSLIQKMVKTRTVSQCVEFYYLSKKLLDKQRKQKEQESRDGETEQQKSVTPICQPAERQLGREEAVPAPSLASFFPCKLCGKMFYKIKSRNAHMKIHRQPQEDWTDRRLQHQVLTHHLALSRSNNLMPTSGSNLLPPQTPVLTFASSGLPGTSNNNSNADTVLNSVTSSNAITPSNSSVLDPSTPVTYSNIGAPNSHAICSINAGDSNQREPTTVFPFHQSWASFGHAPDPPAFYCDPAGKEAVGTETGGVKEPITWQ